MVRGLYVLIMEEMLFFFLGIVLSGGCYWVSEYLLVFWVNLVVRVKIILVVLFFKIKGDVIVNVCRCI